MLDSNYFNFWACIFIGFPLIMLLMTYLCLSTVKKIAKDYLFVNKNKSYIDIFNHYCELTYEAVYKDQVLAFSTSGFKLDGGALETSKRNFVKLFYELAGSNVVRLFSDAYGDEETLTKNLITWFNMKIDTDEILEHSRKIRDNELESK